MMMSLTRISFIPAVVQVGLPILKSELSNLQIPDISGKAGSPIGNIDYELHK